MKNHRRTPSNMMSASKMGKSPLKPKLHLGALGISREPIAITVTTLPPSTKNEVTNSQKHLKR